MKKLGAILFLLPTLSFAAVQYEQDYLSVSQKDQLKQILLEALSSQKLPSLVAAATYGDKVIWARGVGYSDLENKIAPEVQKDLYRWASVSKVATERFSQALEEKGVLDQDKPISAYVNITEPSFMRRCFSSDEEQNKFIGCTKNYGGFGAVVMMPGFPRCFNPKTLGETELQLGGKIYKQQVLDSTISSGNVVYRDASDKTKCSASYNTSMAFVSTNKITLNRLLNHSSGIMHYGSLGFSSEPPEDKISNVNDIKNRQSQGKSQMEWAIPYFYPKAPLLFLPGLGRHYSTFGYNLAGVVLEKASGKTYEEILSSYVWPMGALSIQSDYLGLAPVGPYRRSRTYKLSDGKLQLNQYTTDNSYKIAGGGIMSTIVDLGKFCVAVGQDGSITKNGAGNYSHSGAHPSRSLSLLVLQTGGTGKKQCLVLMTNTNHGDVDLSAVKKSLEKKLYDLKIWQPARN